MDDHADKSIISCLCVSVSTRKKSCRKNASSSTTWTNFTSLQQSYFQMRFDDVSTLIVTSCRRIFRSMRWHHTQDLVIRKNFLPAILVVSTIATLGTTLVLSALQKGAKYTYRISWFLIVNVGVFVFLALSTVLWTNISPRVYLAFLLLMVLLSSFASGLAQNGLFSFGSSFGPMSAQAIMT